MSECKRNCFKVSADLFPRLPLDGDGAGIDRAIRKRRSGAATGTAQVSCSSLQRDGFSHFIVWIVSLLSPPAEHPLRAANISSCLRDREDGARRRKEIKRRYWVTARCRYSATIMHAATHNGTRAFCRSGCSQDMQRHYGFRSEIVAPLTVRCRPVRSSDFSAELLRAAEHCFFLFA